MASGDDKAAEQAGHMAAPTSNAHAQLTLANGEPSTQGAEPNGREWPIAAGLFIDRRLKKQNFR